MSDKWLSILISFIGFLGAVLGSGGIVTHFIEKNEKRAEKRENKIYNALKLSLENDIVIFNALRNNKINGESEEQEKKMLAFLKESFI